MSKGIFDGAEFGDKFKTRSGHQVLFLDKRGLYVDTWFVLLKGDSYPYDVENDGRMCKNVENDLDVVGRWEETIDEKLLDKDAVEYADGLINMFYAAQGYTEDKDLPNDLPSVAIGARNGYKAGFKKAFNK